MATLVSDPNNINSNSFLTLAEADELLEHSLYKTAWDNATDEQKTSSLIFMSRFISYSYIWRGNIVNQHQKLAWPRNNVVDAEGHIYDNDIYPERLKFATAELAQAYNQSDFSSNSTFDEGIKNLELGDLKIEYDHKIIQQGSANSVNNLGITQQIDRTLAPLIIGTVAGTGNFNTARIYRT